MHGRPRKALKPEEEAALTEKAKQLLVLQSQVLSNHQLKNYTKEAVDLSAKLLGINPESYTAWNYRKLAVQHNLNQIESDPDSIKKIWDEELRVVESALRQNFKSYGAWHHRKWVLSMGNSSLDNELHLLNKLHKLDSRNFHAWNYRRFVTASMNRSDLDELKYTEDMVTDFSNYSAWHNRSVLLSNLLEKKVEGFLSKEQVLPNEYELIHQAIFTDQDDQSGYIYHLWLLDQTVRDTSPLLVSSWPPHGSLVFPFGDQSLKSSVASPLTSIHHDLSALPVILCFNQAVKGVNSNTVVVKSTLCTNEDLIWKPLVANSSRTGKVWFTHLKFPDLRRQSVEKCLVEVHIGENEGIISSSGICCASSQFTFRVAVQPVEVEETDRQCGEIISWNDEHFDMDEANLDNLNFGFDQLSIENDSELNSCTWQAVAVAGEIECFRELLAVIDCKYAKLTLARLLKAHDRLIFPSGNKASHSDEILDLYRELMKLDPSHSQLYKDEHSLVFLQKMITNRESFRRCCFQYKGLNSSIEGFPTCVRFNNLSLSRIGSFEKLLWVQMLDLSHNELRSIEGLEALQLLCCLNLSYNKIRSLTALEPLRQLKSLKVLDISNNEIGSHPIDTTRHLCSSPLSHSVGTEWKSDGNVDISNFWESYFIFKGMNLIQLDVSGNAIAYENFKLFLIKVMPELKLLDGEKLH
ncbi:geranylgeranyl transferase type-2 subunit alpha 1-like [Rutidosis leptorrhynchoides]|uniref:geranylgeranyl transferase type-2 subunit alpha 1-like n=1 Tax=Rutidosis leptorrhynchoides TaxID=125765 RepID=UPI003A99EA27